jgi:4-alpha-glucanotransferase
VLFRSRFLARADSGLGEAYRVFKEAQSAWLDDYALFMSIKECFDERARREGVFGAMWANYWPEELARGESAALAEWRRTRAGSIEERCALQFFFFRQFAALRTKTSALGLRLVGDMPIFVAYDSADVWGRRELFLLDQRGRPRSVAGVPPDYFSSEGQLWGNPLYDWPAHRASGYAWWKRRTAAALALCDIVRIDHFRGFQANWAVPYGRESAREGEWRAGPGAELFEALREDLGRDLPIIAEDLGIITPEVAELRQSLGLPGMRVLQFAFSVDAEGVLDTSNPFLPHNHTPDSFAYTGTHDNNTLRGWLDEEVGPPILAFIDEYLGLERDHRTTEARARALIRELFKSVAAWTILPMQDLLGLGSEARMNRPSTLGPINWSWRMCQEGIPDDVGAWLARLARLYGRDP